MAQILNLNPPISWIRPKSRVSRLRFHSTTREQNEKLSWFSLQQELKCNGKFTCLFSGSSSDREEQARKALESALGGKKNEFEKWNEEIKKREEAGGGHSGGGGWFGWGGRFGWSDGDNFWPEAHQTGLTILGIAAMYLVIAKGEVMLAVVINPWLHVLRGTRNGLTFLSSRVFKKTSLDGPVDVNTSKKEVYIQASAKERVLRKWGSD